MSAIEKITEIDAVQAELDDLLSYHGGDQLAAIRSLLNDCRNLRHQLAISEHLTSKGLTRGWKPSSMDGA